MAAFAGKTARKNPDAMEIGQFGHVKGKGEGEDKKGKGKEPKGKSKKNNSSRKGGKNNESKNRCGICWKTGRTTEKCWFNIKGRDQGKGKKSVSAGDTSSVVSAGPSACQVGSRSSIVISFPPLTQHKRKSVGTIGERRLLMAKAVPKR